MWKIILEDETVKYMFQCWLGIFISFISMRLTIKFLHREESLTRYIDWILYYQTTVLLARIVVLLIQR